MLVGIGNMGHALLHYRFHERNKMKIIMAFDLDDHPEVGTPKLPTGFLFTEFLKSRIKFRMLM